MNPSPPSLAPVRFSDLGVPPLLSAVLEQRGITTAFPIQAATLPDSLAGRDVCGMAPTGSGKTLAFGLAIMARLAAKPGAGRRGRRRPSALVLVPTRELAAQIEEVISPLASAIGARVASIYGGVGYAKQLARPSDPAWWADQILLCPSVSDNAWPWAWRMLKLPAPKTTRPLHFSSYAAALEAACAGHGVLLAPLPFSEREFVAGRLLRLSDVRLSSRIGYSLVMRRELALLPRGRSLQRRVLSAVTK